ncbi:MAG TPA: Ger(x)C family spore germination protein [Desulfitobacterium dehalogenans]|uniref:Ger(X)C family spore germination protein n=1 Tax=Desulfitobacterium dehalogenans TaxID=36854 RepID=A0A7C7DC67_9FIRM|nr:Ger(x)C family spore germination protein [Desulfitobacterium dehalogenans]
MRKCLVFALCLFLPVNLLLGCWDRNELSTLAIVQAIGIDMMEDGRISLSTQILKPGALKSGSEKSIWVVTSTGETLFDAARNASLQADRRLFFPHNKAIIIGEETAKKGLIPLFDFLMRDAEARGLAYVFVAKGKAVDILKGEHEQETNPSKAIENLAETSILASILPKRYLIDLFSALEDETTSPILPGIKIYKKSQDGKSSDMILLDDTAVFKKDRLVGWFHHFESRGVLWVLNEVKSASIVVESPLDEDKAVSLDVIKSIARLKPEITDNTLSMTIEVKVEGNLTEQMSAVKLTSPENFAELEKRVAATVEEEIITAVVKAQKWGSDIFKFGEEFHRKYTQEWPELEQDWDELFPEIEVKLDVSVQLNLIGLSSEPLKSERME